MLDVGPGDTEGGPGVLWSVSFLPDGHTIAAGGSRYLALLDLDPSVRR